MGPWSSGVISEERERIGDEKMESIGERELE